VPRNIKINNDTSLEKYDQVTFSEDWSKIIHLEGSTYFACGGSQTNKVYRFMPPTFSNKAFKIDIENGALKRLPDMKRQRQAHGMCRIGNYVYCCGGHSANGGLLKTSERYDLARNVWYEDLPELSEEKYSMTMIVVSNTWLYCFGGATQYYAEGERRQTVERLNTGTLREAGRYHSGYNKKICNWESIELKIDYGQCCQQGVIPLPTSIDDKHRRYLIFGGIHMDYHD